MARTNLPKIYNKEFPGISVDREIGGIVYIENGAFCECLFWRNSLKERNNLFFCQRNRRFMFYETFCSFIGGKIRDNLFCLLAGGKHQDHACDKSYLSHGISVCSARDRALNQRKQHIFFAAGLRKSH